MVAGCLAFSLLAHPFYTEAPTAALNRFAAILICLEPLRLLTSCTCLVFRHEQPRGAGAGGARLQDAVPPGLPHLAARADAAVLEEGRRGAAHLRVPASLLGGLLHSHRASVPARGQPLSPSPARARTGAGAGCKTLEPSQPGLYFRDLYSFLSSTRAFQFHHQPLKDNPQSLTRPLVSELCKRDN